jgi:hypothetical protein
LCFGNSHLPSTKHFSLCLAWSSEELRFRRLHLCSLKPSCASPFVAMVGSWRLDHFSVNACVKAHRSLPSKSSRTTPLSAWALPNVSKPRHFHLFGGCLIIIRLFVFFTFLLSSLHVYVGSRNCHCIYICFNSIGFSNRQKFLAQILRIR